jgi:hypothetical protein
MDFIVALPVWQTKHCTGNIYVPIYAVEMYSAIEDVRSIFPVQISEKRSA